ncbi:MAG: UbiD family decarboxylase, partial [Halioglobus sp.]
MNYCDADLRSYLTQASDRTLTIRKPVDPATEIAALCSETVQPTVFENLTGYPDFRLADGLTRFRDTQALALGIEGGPEGVIPGYAAKLAAGPGTTVEIENSPIKEVIWKGDEARLSRLPIPIASEGYDFPHLGIKEQDFLVPTISGGMGVTCDPEGNQNTFFTMAKVVGDQRIHFFMLPGHTARNVQAWQERGERCPMALVIGCHPAYEIGGAYTGPHPGFSELDLIAGIIGGPVPTIRAETLDMQVPALAEIVIEGFIDPNKAPYLHASSHSDSYAPILSEEPFFDITAITMRKNPIYRHIQPNRFTEHHSLAEFIVVPPLFGMLQAKGLPVIDIHMPLRSCGNCAIIQMTANNPLEVREVMLTSM